MYTSRSFYMSVSKCTDTCTRLHKNLHICQWGTIQHQLTLEHVSKHRNTCTVVLIVYCSCPDPSQKFFFKGGLNLSTFRAFGSTQVVMWQCDILQQIYFWINVLCWTIISTYLSNRLVWICLRHKKYFTYILHRGILHESFS